jgi:methyl-accepting chemotaxis protein
MAITVTTAAVVLILFLLGSIISWLVAGRTSHIFEILAFLYVSVAITVLALVVIDDNQFAGYGGIALAALILFALGVRLRAQFNKPTQIILNEHRKMLTDKDFTIIKNQYFKDDKKLISKIYNSEHEVLNLIHGLLRDLLGYEDRSSHTVRELLVLYDNLTNSGVNITNSVDEILQSSVLIEELSGELRSMILALNLTLDDTTKRMQYTIDQAEKLSDQTNLIAVNASIEAAQTEGTGKNFEIVADGIQKLSGRSRTNSEDLHKLNTQLYKKFVQQLKHMDEILNKFDEFNLNILELSDTLSISAHQEENALRVANTKISDLNDLGIKLKEELNKYKF